MFIQLFAYRAARRVIDPHLANTDYQTSWINNAIRRGLSREITNAVHACAQQFGRTI